MIDYDEVMKELQKLKALPEGYSMGYTDHGILVAGPSLGFAITREAIENGWHIWQYPPTLDKLIECHERAEWSRALDELAKDE